ncbi:hypothetical protein CLAFUW4_02958 [Fulvia fulva]|uniref:Uncharacterized protein n=1 Tax=Passalora fulva TaxID=5499 RepID=A0A9Q8LA69_PASFU|nr:uncharacterized protein CLAFUR5_02944 [Fulvia fulva]KAK4631158.1 hypothetical protein CLAFUR4_02951 [Fulvia fulva]KAK4633692.1 hypothetical protein CLAFUR0_02954 [Fulvia fulva]UJO13761.1 hypothetical protein CLAFUR5_02944 [Fulvia fulva]WPV11536.1 hypothetical protein CLAFUW4_02958 [Fulvia fulva]WPV26300.1 hypothetical protein CLAFUW7_02955 [Fulvia fulva]
MSSESKGKGVLFSFTSLLLFLVWGMWKHSNDERVTKAKKASAEYREQQKKSGRKSVLPADFKGSYYS